MTCCRSIVCCIIKYFTIKIMHHVSVELEHIHSMASVVTWLFIH